MYKNSVPILFTNNQILPFVASHQKGKNPSYLVNRLVFSANLEVDWAEETRDKRRKEKISKRRICLGLIN